MRITNKLRQFKDEKSIIIVASKQGAIFYEISDGSVNRLEAFKIPRPRYSDNEGFFQTAAHGRMLSSGSAREYRDENTMTEFLREFKGRLKHLPQNFEKLYIFVPSYTKNMLKKALPREFKERIEKLIEGNYYSHNLSFLLEKLNTT